MKMRRRHKGTHSARQQPAAQQTHTRSKNNSNESGQGCNLDILHRTQGTPSPILDTLKVCEVWDATAMCSIQ